MVLWRESGSLEGEFFGGRVVLWRESGSLEGEWFFGGRVGHYLGPELNYANY